MKDILEQLDNVDLFEEEGGEEKVDRTKAVFISGLKNLIVVIIAGLAVKFGGNEWYILLAPILKMVEKYFTAK